MSDLDLDTAHPRHAVPIQLYYAQRLAAARKRMSEAGIPELSNDAVKIHVPESLKVPMIVLRPKPAAKPKRPPADRPWQIATCGLVTPSMRAWAIIDEVAAKYGMCAGDVFGRSRVAKFQDARTEAIQAIAKTNPEWSSVQIGRFFGRDHSTILFHLNGRTKARNKVSKPVENSLAPIGARLARKDVQDDIER